MKKIIALVLLVATLVTGALALTSCSKYKTKFGKEFTPVDSQMDVLLKLNAGSIDVGIMDSVMAGYYMSKDSKYANSLTIIENLVLAEEQYGIAARKGSGLTKKINEALIALANNGTVDSIADKYGLKSEICIDKNATVAELTASEYEDWNYVKNNGKFIVGYTIFAPIAYEADGELTGFDIELAKAVAAYLGLTVEFKEINWDSKEAELNGKNIDCIWNGMTITAERQEQMEVSIPYMYNKQVAVIRKSNVDIYRSTADMGNAIIGAEKGSAGMACVVEED